MAGGRPRQPIELIQKKGKKHTTKAEIEARKKSEVKAQTDEIKPPKYLTAKQKHEFERISNQLIKLKVFGETDCDCLARYIIANDMYIAMTKKLREKEVIDDPVLLDIYSKQQDKFFKQCERTAADLGLTISSRCRLVVPQTVIEVKENKFAKFEKADSG